MKKILYLSLCLMIGVLKLYAQDTSKPVKAQGQEDMILEELPEAHLLNVEEKPEDELLAEEGEKKDQGTTLVQLEAKTKYIKSIKEYEQALIQINQEAPTSFEELEKHYQGFLEEYQKLKIELPHHINEARIEEVSDYLEKIKLALKNIEIKKGRDIDFLGIYQNKIKSKLPILEKILNEYQMIEKEKIIFDEDISSLISNQKVDDTKKNKDKFDNQLFIQNQIKELKLKITNSGLLILEIDKIKAEWTDEIFNYKNKVEGFNKKKDILTKKMEYLKLRVSARDEIKQSNEETLRIYDKKNHEFEENKSDILKRKSNIEKLKQEYKDDYLFNLNQLQLKSNDQISNQGKEIHVIPNQDQPVIANPEKEAHLDMKDELYEKEKLLKAEIKQIELSIGFSKEKKDFSKKYMPFLKSYLGQFDEFLVDIDQHIKLSIYQQELEQQVMLLNIPIFPGVEFFTKHVQSKGIQAWIDELIDQYFMIKEMSADINQEYEKLQQQLDYEDKQALVLQNKLVGENGLNEQLKKNKELNDFVKDLERLETNELLKVYHKNKKDFDDNSNQEKELRLKFQEISKELAQFLEDRRLKLSDPILRQFDSEATSNQAYLDFVKQATHLFRNTKESDQAPSKKEEVNPEVAHQSIKVTAKKDEAQQEEKSLEAKLYFNEALRSKLPPRVTFYEDYQRSQEEYLVILKKREKLILALLNLQKNRSDIIKQLWRSATMLYRRYAGFESPEIRSIKEEIEPFQKESWTKQAELKNIEELQIQQLKDLSWYQLEPNFQSMLEPLKLWENELDNLIHVVRNKDELAQKAIHKAEEEMSPTEKSKREHDLIDRMEQDEYWYEWIWEFIPSNHTENIDALLKNLYSELLDYEAKQKHLIKQNKYLTESISTLEKQRNSIEALIDLVKGTVDIYAQRLVKEKNQLLLAIDPNQEELIKNTDLTSDASYQKQLPHEIEIKTEEELQARLETVKLSFYHLQKYQSYLNELKAILAPQGHYDSSLGLLRDQSAQLETEIERLNEPIKRLIGVENIEQASHTTDDQQASKASSKVKKVKKGEIYKSRDARLKEKLKGLIKTLLLVLFIPILAIFISRFFNSIGQKILDYVKKEQNPNANAVEIREKEERASTLFHVSKTLINVIIMLIAFIYILKAINVDVTPIIASAGVLGLALAFGSQALVKDFFAGFFILLENQYNIGDIVKINSIQGKIEQITLRLTIVRDIEGIVHFIPNGSISMVSNCNKGWAQARIEVGVGYQNNPQRVLQCLNEVVEALKNQEEHKSKIINMEAMGIERFDDCAVIYRVHIQVIPGEQWSLARLCRIMIMNKFKEEGIDIPFPQLVIHQALTADPLEKASK